MTIAKSLPSKSLFGWVPTWLPVLLVVFSAVAAFAQQDSQAASTKERVDYIWTNGIPVVSERLARIEQKQTDDSEKIDQILGEVKEIRRDQRK